MPMLVLLPATVARRKIRQYLTVALGVVLLAGSLAGAASITASVPTRRVAPDRHPGTIVSPLRDTRSVPASAGFAALTDSLAREVEQLTSIPSVLPTVGRVSSRFALRRDHPILHVARPHEGVDIAAPMGAPVVAPAAGVVVTVAERAGYGLLLELDHGHGVVTRYGHLARAWVRVGQSVARGQRLADVGNSGLSTGPHLHYEIRLAGAVVDPLSFRP